MSITTIYKVYGCTDDGSQIEKAIFTDLVEACYYAVANYGKIHYNLPEIEEQTYYYIPENHTVSVKAEIIEPAQIYYVTKNCTYK